VIVGEEKKGGSLLSKSDLCEKDGEKKKKEKANEEAHKGKEKRGEISPRWNQRFLVEEKTVLEGATMTGKRRGGRKNGNVGKRMKEKTRYNRKSSAGHRADGKMDTARKTASGRAIHLQNKKRKVI